MARFADPLRSNLYGIIEDLPYVANDKYSQYMIDRCNEHRNSYKKEVEFAKSIYSNMSVMVTGSTMYNNKDQTLNRHVNMERYKDESSNLICAMVYEKTKACQKLTRIDMRHGIYHKLYSEYEIISAFYLPKDHYGWIRLYESGEIISQHNGSSIHTTDLEEVLHQSHTLPSWNDSEFLEYVLWLSRQGSTGVIHRQAEEIEIDGVFYVRVLFVQPFLPIGMRGCTTTYFLKSEYSLTIYLEVTNVCREQWESIIVDTLWVPNNPEEYHLIHKDTVYGNSADPPESELSHGENPSVMFMNNLPSIIVPVPSLVTNNANIGVYYDYWY